MSDINKDLDELFDSNFPDTLCQELRAEVIKLRTAIRYHRDQKGDDRCWLDDAKLYESLPETVAVDHTLPPKEEFLKSCARFHECRQGKTFKNMDDCYDSGEYRSLNLPEQNKPTPGVIDMMEFIPEDQREHWKLRMEELRDETASS